MEASVVAFMERRRERLIKERKRDVAEFTKTFTDEDWASLRILIGEQFDNGLRMRAFREGHMRVTQDKAVQDLMRDTKAPYSFGLEVAALKRLLKLEDVEPEPDVEVSYFE